MPKFKIIDHGYNYSTTLFYIQEEGSDQGGYFGPAKPAKPANFRIGLVFGRQSKGNLSGKTGIPGIPAVREFRHSGRFGVPAAGESGDISAGSADQ